MYVYMKMLFSLPIIGVASNVSIYIMMLIFMIYFTVVERKWDFILLIIPLILSIIIIIFAPCIYGHPRYAFPILYSFPIALGYYLYVNNKYKLSD